MRAFVTGGTAGIGAACVARLTADGHTVAFTGRNAARGVEVASRTGATFLNADITDRAAADQALARAVETLGGLDAVVANAGILSRTPLASISGDEMWTLLETNLTAQFRTSRAAWPHLVAAGGGSIALIGSDTSIRGSHRVPAYSVVKAGTVMLSDMLAADGAAVRIRANAVCPGNTLPGMAGDDPATWPITADGLQVTAAEIASCVCWLLSAEAVHVTGATIRIDGGIGAAFIPPPA
ncbi:MAG: meso-butanediol dehydrogenase / (S,S)-butanediol dehydrogenase / diacetyl reductase [Gaiellaceae bacterium]|nr:meso-butanediol dehydrogenase / (S,S)-butanediol dehydrogenase / diacetyl reductase [Gaiellaceae bacterium]